MGPGPTPRWPGSCGQAALNALPRPQPLARQEEQTRLVRQFHFHGWPEIGIPAEGKGMLDLIAAVQKQQQQTGNHPITVHCRWAPPAGGAEPDPTPG